MINSHETASKLHGGNLSAMLTSAREGDDGDVGQLLEATRRYLLLVANRSLDAHLQQKVAPSDLVQETFMDAHHQFKRFQGSSEAELFAWLRQILLHKAADAGRRYRGTMKRDITEERLLSSDSRGPQPQAESEELSPSRCAIGREREQRVSQALQQLPPDYHQVIQLRSFERLPFAQVAEKMGRSEAAVGKLWFRAIRQLRKHLMHLDQSNCAI